ncbi:protein dispatched-like [Glandiceps talaboti]
MTSVHPDTDNFKLQSESVNNQQSVDDGHNSRHCGNDGETRPSLNTDREFNNTHVAVISTMDGSTNKTSSVNAKRFKKPLAWCKFIVKKPKTAFALALSCNMSMLLITIALVVSGYNVFPTVFTRMPLQLEDDDQWLRPMAWLAKDWGFDYQNNEFKVDRVESTSDERTELYDAIFLIYEKPGGNILTKENLQAIRDLEEEFMNKPQYNDYCLLDENGDCVKPASIVRYFDGTYAAMGSIFNDPGFDNIPAVLEAANSSTLLKGAVQYHFGKDVFVDVTANIAKSSITRSIVQITMSNSVLHTDDFIVSTYYSGLNDMFANNYKGLNIYFFSGTLWESAVFKQVFKDLALVFGSCVFIFGFLWFQTRSLWITGFAIIGIITSFTGANLIYRFILDFQFFGIFHILSIFIILGIGADDVFVFMDTWRSTGFEVYPGLEYRLSDVYRRASVTMFVTSLTTAMAFIVSGFSPLLGVKSFGIFSGILVLVNYLTVIVFFPTVVITYHNIWRLHVCCCCRPCVKHPTESTEVLNTPTTKKNVVVRFFTGPYFRFITHKVYRWIIIFCFVAIVAIFTYFAAKLGPQEKAVQIFKDGNNFVIFNDKSTSAFVESDADVTTEVLIVWGLQNQDLSSCHHTDYECTGETVWDNSFDLNPTPSQKALRDFCNRLRNVTEEENSKLHIKRDIVTGELKVNCFIDNMYNFYENLNLTGHQSGTDFSMPIGEVKMRALMEANPAIFDTSKLHETFYRYFETGLGYWLTAGYTVQGLPSNKYSEMLGEAVDRWDTYDIVSGTDVFGTRLKYVAFKVTTSLSHGSVGYERGMEILDAWETFVNNEMEKMPPSVANGFQCTCDNQNLWHWIKVQKTLADSAIQGIILGIALAFPVLVLATQNIIIGSMATVSIGLTTCCVVGIIPMIGWKLGLLESLNLSLIVGLAVDYVVHLAEGYHLSPKEDRLGRLQDMLEHVGVSVISGAATTLGASLFMLFAQILFFMQFGIFMFCTIGFSLIFSLGLFTTLLGLIGPQGETGSLKFIYRWVIGRKKTDIDCSSCDGKGFHASKLSSCRSIGLSPIHSAINSPAKCEPSNTDANALTFANPEKIHDEQ